MPRCTGRHIEYANAPILNGQSELGMLHLAPPAAMLVLLQRKHPQNPNGQSEHVSGSDRADTTTDQTATKMKTVFLLNLLHQHGD